MADPLRRFAGLRVGAALSLALAAALGAAAALEAEFGRDLASHAVVDSIFFRALLVLFALHLLVGLVASFPRRRTQVPAALVRAGLLLLLAGLAISERTAVRGTIALAEGQSTDRFVLDRDALRVATDSGSSLLEVPLDPDRFGLEPAQDSGPTASIPGTPIRVTVVRYLPDAKWDERVFDDARRERDAVQIMVSSQGKRDEAWVLADAPASLGPLRATLVPIADDEELEQRLHADAPAADLEGLEILVGPGPLLHVRLFWPGTAPLVRSCVLGERIETPWPGGTVVLKRRFEHARLERTPSPLEVPRPTRRPALLVRLEDGRERRDVWLERGRPRRLDLGDFRCELAYGPRRMTLGFVVTLDRFVVAPYPGARHPRSFESRLRFLRHEGTAPYLAVARVNRPARFGGFRFVQTGYVPRPTGPLSSLMLVRDPGETLSGAGLLLVLAGLWSFLLLARTLDDRRIRP